MSDSGLSTSGELAAQPPMPVRRLHNYLYCPRLFYLQWVENIFEENADTAAGSAVHRQADQPSRFDDAKATALREGLAEGAKLRSLRLESIALGLIGVVDIVEGGPDGACAVDYKKGSARRLDDDTRAAKEPDAVQMAAYALLLREHGTPVESAAIYYAEDKRRVPVALTDELFAKTRTALAEARAVATAGKMPPPLVDDQRCNYCSAYPICLPRESHWWAQARERAVAEDTQLRLGFPPGDLPPEFTGEPPSDHDPLPPPRPPRDDGELLVVQKPGSQVGQRGGEIVVTVQREVVRKLPLHQVRAIYLYGAVQLTAQAAESCLEHGIDVAYFAASGRFLGLLRGLPASGVDARLGQARMFAEPFFRLRQSRECIRAKIHNQRTMLMRNGDVPDRVLRLLADARDATEDVRDLGELLGCEGAAASLYFEQFASMLKGAEWRFDFQGRNRRPPRDPVNAMLSLGYSILAKELAGVCHAVGLDPFLGFMHQPRYGRPALALDLMEEFRPLIADSVAISLANRGEVNPEDFISAATGTFLNEQGRRRFWEAWFRRMDTEVSHPQFGYKMSYRRMLEVQARQLWRVVRGDAPIYHGFTTR
ncbi:MAG: CRISPR-associated endonuclease Cas1 [Candidatus Didemnitutus sp.]|nr:CRISPR-associated endonuclease Cas1 [Candidatus Didemnitutus sp.]